MVENGFQDFNYFKGMEEVMVKDTMCPMCGIKKFVHVQKLLAAWKLLTLRSTVQPAVVAVNKSRYIPSEVLDLMVPSLTTQQLEFFNSVVENIYYSAYHLFPSKKYTSGQRVSRYAVKVDVDDALNFLSYSSMSTGLCGNWINILRYSGEAGVVRSDNFLQAKNLLTYLDK